MLWKKSLKHEKVVRLSGVLIFGFLRKSSHSDANFQTFDSFHFAHAQLWTPEFSLLHFQNIPVALRMLQDSAIAAVGSCLRIQFHDQHNLI